MRDASLTLAAAAAAAVATTQQQQTGGEGGDEELTASGGLEGGERERANYVAPGQSPLSSSSSPSSPQLSAGPMQNREGEREKMGVYEVG